jgi:hypothetical protein
MTRRRPGRPPLDPTDKSVGVSVRFPSRTLDAMYKHAAEARVSVPEWIRRTVAPAQLKFQK